MDSKQRSEFRKSKEWHEFKAKCRLHTSRDFITNEPLSRSWNLHHLDLNVGRYSNIGDMNRFMPLNSTTHKVIHEVYKWYKKDKKVIDRLLLVFEKMEVYTNEL